MIKPIVWTIAGSDSGGGAGIQADLHTFQAMGVYAASVITAITAQNSQVVAHVQLVSVETLQQQLQVLQQDLPAVVIKLGMLGSDEHLLVLQDFLQQYSGCVVYDPVMLSSSGAELFAKKNISKLIANIFPYVDLLTPNLVEAEALLGRTINTAEQMRIAAQELLQFGPKQILLKGGHLDSKLAQDYYCDSEQGFWLSNIRQMHSNTHGSGCVLSAAISAALALDRSITEAVVLGKMYVNHAVCNAERYGKGPGPVAHVPWLKQQRDLPWLSTEDAGSLTAFPKCIAKLGFYPIVDSFIWVKLLVDLGVSTIQLRIKKILDDIVEQEIIQSIQYCHKYKVQLFINDHWQCAVKHQAYGVHLGQEDLLTVDRTLLLDAGVRLGISTHNIYEVAKAHAWRPSYLAIGPIYSTTSKVMQVSPQGINNLNDWSNCLDYPLVAIGGIDLQRLPKVLATGVDGVACIAAITKAQDIKQAVLQWLEFF